jgi:iron uptake system component EfeO
MTPSFIVRLFVLGSLSSATACTSSTPATTDGPTVQPTQDGGPSSSDAAPATKTDADYEAKAVADIHASFTEELDALAKYARELQASAPTPDARGWDPVSDATAIAAMKSAWTNARIAYEHIEGVLAALFPEIDTALDARYDDFLTTLGGKGDDDVFDGAGVTGMHAIERILFADTILQRAVDFEKTLPGYKPASFPSTAAEAVRFKTKLVQKFIDDVTEIQAQWKPAKIDIGVAFNGLILLMNEQHEKVIKAATGEEESRYADVTLFDLRNNLDGTSKIYHFFQPWILSKTTNNQGKMSDAAITAGFEKLRTLYASYPGNAIPQPPASWSALHPTPPDLASKFGVLFSTVSEAVDPDAKGSLVFEMNRVAEWLGFPAFKKG